jgi:hypothetical protein
VACGNEKFSGGCAASNLTMLPSKEVLPGPADTEKLALAGLLRCTIEGDRYPLSPRIRTLNGILDKIEPPAAC